MKFSEMPYERPNLEKLAAVAEQAAAAIKGAESAEEQIAAYDEFETAAKHIYTLSTIASIRHSVNTKDAYYDEENRFMDENSPRIEAMNQKVIRTLLNSRFRPELEQHYGALMFKNLEISVRSFSPEIVELMQQVNKLCSDYQKLYASAVVEFDGKKLPLPMLGPYKESTDREIRRKAFAAEAGFFDAHREELDRLYDELIHVRDAEAKKLGYRNFIQLGYDRLGRNCYTAEQVAAFREQIARDMVPIVAKIKESQRRRLGVERFCFYDDPLFFPDGNPRPEGTSDEILAAGQEMYRALSPETREFIDFMFRNELFDVLSKDGKAPGGYCTEIPDYLAPFIFSNFNGTSGDVDVLTHEAGHAFAAYRALRQNLPAMLINPTMETAECHSMSMEFLTEPYHKNFFGSQAEKYKLMHGEAALIFIPYGCMVDEFQHRCYEEPDLTPAERNELWLSLEKKYRPWIDFDGLPFYGRGAGWQRQLHIYLYPLYYIDYCMAQTIALQFWMASLKDREDAWKRYLTFVDGAGAKTFEELVRAAGLRLPYDEGSIRKIGTEVSEWLEKNAL